MARSGLHLEHDRRNAVPVKIYHGESLKVRSGGKAGDLNRCDTLSVNPRKTRENQNEFSRSYVSLVKPSHHEKA